jgi:hypothetical protein
MMPLEALEPTLVAPQGIAQWPAGGRPSRALHALVVSDHLHAYLVVTEQRLRPRA